MSLSVGEASQREEALQRRAARANLRASSSQPVWLGAAVLQQRLPAGTATAPPSRSSSAAASTLRAASAEVADAGDEDEEIEEVPQLGARTVSAPAAGPRATPLVMRSFTVGGEMGAGGPGGFYERGVLQPRHSPGRAAASPARPVPASQSGVLSAAAGSGLDLRVPLRAADSAVYARGASQSGMLAEQARPAEGTLSASPSTRSRADLRPSASMRSRAGIAAAVPEQEQEQEGDDDGPAAPRLQQSPSALRPRMVLEATEPALMRSQSAASHRSQQQQMVVAVPSQAVRGDQASQDLRHSPSMRSARDGATGLELVPQSREETLARSPSARSRPSEQPEADGRALRPSSSSQSRGGGGALNLQDPLPPSRSAQSSRALVLSAQGAADLAHPVRSPSSRGAYGRAAADAGAFQPSDEPRALRLMGGDQQPPGVPASASASSGHALRSSPSSGSQGNRRPARVVRTAAPSPASPLPDATAMAARRAQRLPLRRGATPRAEDQEEGAPQQRDTRPRGSSGNGVRQAAPRLSPAGAAPHRSRSRRSAEPQDERRIAPGESQESLAAAPPLALLRAPLTRARGRSPGSSPSAEPGRQASPRGAHRLAHNSSSSSSELELPRGGGANGGGEPQHDSGVGEPFALASIGEEPVSLTDLDEELHRRAGAAADSRIGASFSSRCARSQRRPFFRGAQLPSLPAAAGSRSADQMPRSIFPSVPTGGARGRTDGRGAPFAFCCVHERFFLPGVSRRFSNSADTPPPTVTQSRHPEGGRLRTRRCGSSGGI